MQTDQEGQISMVNMDKMRAGRNLRLGRAKQLVKEIREDEQCGGIELNDWEQEFVESLEERLAENTHLSPAQMDKLEEIWDRV